jgi:uroporphyrin-III C-methyltransferase
MPAADGPSEMGRVYLVGAGPGLPELISVAGYRALTVADVVLADQMVREDFLEQLGVCSTGKLFCHVGENRARWSQETICRELARHALAGKTVVRLKGGDPFVFGRGADELEYLTARGIPCEVIVGPSATIAVPTSAGLPLTRHACGRSFAVVTARVVGGAIQERFPRCDSLVIVMGVAVLYEIVDRLLGDGWPTDTPAAIVERGTLPWERHVAGPLDRLVAIARRDHVSSPACIVIGDAAAGVSPLTFRPTVLFTGLDPTAFRSLGNLLHWPAMQIQPHPEAQARTSRVVRALRAGRFGTVAFTDKQGINRFFGDLHSRHLDARVFGGVRIVTASEEVSGRLQGHGLRADAVAGTRTLADEIARGPRRPVLVLAGTHVPSDVVAGLTAADVRFEVLLLHRLVPHPDLGRPLPSHDVVYFVSPSAVRVFHATYGQETFRREVWCMGEATREALAQYGVESQIVLPYRSPAVNVAAHDHPAQDDILRSRHCDPPDPI